MIQAFEAIYFPLITAVVVSYMFWYVIFLLSFRSKCFLIFIIASFIHELFQSVF